MTLIDIVRTDVVTATRETSAFELARTLRETDVGSVVVTDDRVPVGIVTDRDIATRVVAEGLDPRATTAENVMTDDPVTVEMDRGVFEVTTAMRQEGVRRIPVVENGELAGIVTLDDLVTLLTEELGNLAAVVEAETPPY